MNKSFALPLLAGCAIWHFLGSASSAQTYTGPITITGPGVYSGNWQSTDPSIPAVKIRTSGAVTIQNSRIVGPGMLIDANDIENHNLTVLNTYALGTNPNVAGKAKQPFISAALVTKLVVQNCYLVGTAGIGVNEYSGSGAGDNRIIINNNRVRNIDCRLSDGVGGYQSTGHVVGHFVLIDNVHAVPGIEVAWNEVVNEPYNSRVDDVINMYQSSGTSASPILVHDNFIHGAYPADPVHESYSGGGIIADGAGTPSTTTQFYRAYNNQVVSTANYGVAIAAGHDNYFYNNRAAASGTLYDGQWIVSQNIGAYVWNINSLPANVFFNNTMQNSQIGWKHKDNSGNVVRNDMWFPNGVNCTGNVAWPVAVLQDVEIGEFPIWKKKVAAAGQSIGTNFPEFDLLTNGGFEQGNNFWENLGAANAIQSKAAAGNWCLEVGPGAGGRQEAVVLLPGRSYLLEATGSVDNAAETGAVSVDFYDGNGASLGSQTLTFSSTAYTQKTLGFTTPAALSYAEIHAAKASGVGSLFHVDEVHLYASAVYEAEALGVVASSGDTNRTITSPSFSGGSAMILDANAVGDYITFLLPNINAGNYNVRVGVKNFNTRGIVQLAIASATVGVFGNVGSARDEYAATETYAELDLGTWSPISTGDKWARFSVTGKNASSTGYTLTVDYIKLTPL